MLISVVIPAYNEARRIVPSLERIFAYMDDRHRDYEVIVVDDGSTDATANVVQARFGTRPQLRTVSYGGNRGKGYAVRFGALHARGTLVLFSDADLSTPIEEMEKMLALVDAGCQLVIGTRAHAQSDIRRRQPFYREFSGKLFNVLVRLVVLPQFHDTQCGFKLFARAPMIPVLERLQIDGFAFDVEMLALAHAAGLKIGEVPVVWSNSPLSMVRLGPAMRAFLDLLRIRHEVRRH